MKSRALLYQTRQASRVWLALSASALLHCAAVAIAEINRNPNSEAGELPSSPPDVEVTIAPEPETPTAPPEVPELLPPLTLPDQFHDEAPTPPPVHSQRKAAPLVRHLSGKPSVATVSSARAFAVNAPRPEYPYEARRGRITGEGVAVMTIDPASGRVIDVAISRSTGSLVLDRATVAGFRRWRFKAGTPAQVRCPITYTLTGAAY